MVEESYQIELIINFSGRSDSCPIPRVIGNVVVVYSSCSIKRKKQKVDVQLQEGEVGVAVVCLALALLHDIVLEDARRLRVVAIQPIEDLLHVIGPLRREVKRDAHDGCVDERRRVGVEGLVKFAQCEPGALATH